MNSVGPLSASESTVVDVTTGGGGAVGVVGDEDEPQPDKDMPAANPNAKAPRRCIRELQPSTGSSDRDNIFITNDGRAKILDFGLAKLTQPNASTAGATLPTTPQHTGLDHVS